MILAPRLVAMARPTIAIYVPQTQKRLLRPRPSSSPKAANSTCELKRELKRHRRGRARPTSSARSHELQELGEALLDAARRPLRHARPRRQAATTPSRDARRITNFEGKRRQMQFIGKLMRAARRRARCARPSPTCRARPRPRDRRAARGRALARPADRRRRRARRAGSQTHPGTDASSCAPWCARPARTQGRPPGAAPAASAYRELFQLVSARARHGRSRRRRPSDAATMTRPRRPRPHRHRLDQRPRVQRRLRGQGPARRCSDWLRARAAQPDRLRVAPDPRRAGRHQRGADRAGRRRLLDWC